MNNGKDEGAKKAAIDRTDHIESLTGYQNETFDLLSRLKSRLSPVSSQMERPDTDIVQAPVVSHIANNVDNARQINNMLRNVLDGLEI